MLLAFGLLLAQFAMAQDHTGQFGGCIDDESGVTNNCTANDVNIALILNQTDLSCEAGSTVDVDLIGELVAGAAERWDIGFFIALDGGEARTGSCYQDFLFPADETCPSTTPGSYEPGALTLNPDGSIASFTPGGPFYDGECAIPIDPADACGDLEQGVFNYYQFPETLTVPCEDNDGDGRVDIGSCVSWDNTTSRGTPQKPSCLLVGDTLPNTKAKCRCEIQNIGNVYVAGKIIVDKNTIPTPSTQSFDFTLTGPDALNVPFSLTDAATPFDSGPLEPSDIAGGTYSVVELGPPSGWEATSVTCTSDDEGNPTETPTAIDLGSGETVTCVFVNTEICPASHTCDTYACGETYCVDTPGSTPNNCDGETFYTATTTCRTGSGDLCDPDESCTGSSFDCPVDTVTPATTTCRTGSGDLCDPDESCTGVAGEACPTDVVTPATTTCRPGANECDPDDSCTGVPGEVCPTHETEFCSAEGCSPGFWRNHMELWDGVGTDEATEFVKTTWTWNGTLGIPSCDGFDFASSDKTLAQTIASPSAKKGGSNTLFHLTACMVSSDALDGFEESLTPLASLITDIQSACAAGGSELEDLRSACADANNHNEIDLFCPLASSGVFTVEKQYIGGPMPDVEISAYCTHGWVSNNPQTASAASPMVTFEIEGLEPFDEVTCTATEVVPPGYSANEADCQDNDRIDTGCVIFNEYIGDPD